MKFEMTKKRRNLNRYKEDNRSTSNIDLTIQVIVHQVKQNNAYSDIGLGEIPSNTLTKFI